MSLQKIFLLLLLLFVFTLKANSQCNQPNAQFEFPRGETQFCEGAIVEIDNLSDIENPTSCIDFMTLDWGDDTPIDTFQDFGNKFHTYDISDSLACASDFPPQYGITLTVFYVNGRSNPIIKFIDIYPKPVAAFSVNAPICTSSPPVCLMNASCWDSLWNWSVRPLPSGTPILYSEEEPCHSFNGVGNYEIQLIASNNCPVDQSLQSDTAVQIVQVIPEAEAEAVATAGVTDMVADTMIVCLEDGGIVDLDGSNSLNETSYLWDAFNNSSLYDWIVDPPSQSDPTISNPSIIFFQGGLFTIELTVNNSCDVPSRDTLFFRVIDSQGIELEPQDDGCISLDYQPEPFDPAYQYTLNGMPVSSFPVTLADGQYIVTASLDQAFCDNFTVSDTFVVLQEATANILSPDTTICSLDGPLTLQAQPALGEWRLNGMLFSGILDPADALDGINIITYGNEPCITSDTMIVRVIQADITMPPPTEVCIDDLPVVFTALPGGGFWLGTGVDSSGSFDPVAAGVGTHMLYYRYTHPTLTSCSTLDSFLVTVSRLQVDFVVDTCENTTVFFDTTGTSAFDRISWSFGDGGTSNQVRPGHQYPSASSYNVTVEIEKGACTADTTKTISIEEPARAAFSIDYDPLRCSPLLLNITDNSSGSNLRYRWEINGQLYSTDPNPPPALVEAFERDSLIELRLILQNDCTESIATESLIVRPQPVSRFGSSKNSYCSGDTIPLSNNARGNPEDYVWLYNGTVLSTDSLPPVIVHLTTVVDTIRICLVVSNECGRDTSCVDIEIIPTDVRALFNLDPPVVCVGDTVRIINLSTNGVPVLYDLGDGTITSTPNPVHVYQTAQTYTIRQQAFGCGFDVYEQRLEVVEAPAASFNNPAFGCPGDPLLFENQSSTNAIRFEWNFGDTLAVSPLSTLSSPVYTFERPGQYNVCLTVFNNNSCADVICQPVRIFDPPVAGFRFSDSLCLGDEVLFESSATGNSLSCFYDFGDGNEDSGCAPAHVFPGPAIYLVTQIVTDGNNCKDTSVQQLTVRPVPVPDFRIIPEDGCHPGSITFANESTDANSYRWDFGDGDTSDLSNPVHLYQQPGTYTVRLLAGQDGICFQETTGQVTIYESPTAAFSVQPSVCLGDSLVFQNNSTGAIVDHEWDFGDGFFSFEPNPTHVFPASDTFQVRLIVRTAEGCADTSRQSLVVHPFVAAGLSTDSLRCFGDEDGRIDLTVDSGTPPYNYDWSNGAETEDLNGLSAGLYTVVISDINGCQWQGAISVEQPDSLEALLTSYQMVDCFGEQTGAFEVAAAGGTPPYQYQWPGGSTSQELSGLAAGIYLLTVTDVRACRREIPLLMEENARIIPATRVQDISCFGENDGALLIDTIRGGIPLFRGILTGPLAQDSLQGFAFTNLGPGDYTLILRDSLDCEQRYNYSLQEPDSIFVAIEDIFPDSLDLGNAIDIVTDYNAQQPVFEWSPPTGLSDPGIPEPTASPLNTTVYQLKMTDINGCMAIDSLLIPVRKSRNIFIPAAFTPDQNGTNDIFFVRSEDPGVEEIESMKVFNRWGSLIFENYNFQPDDEREGWNGEYRGKLAPQDRYTYVVLVRYKDGIVNAHEGLIQILLP